MIKKGGAINQLTPKTLLNNCQAIYFIKDRTNIVSTGALKLDRPNYRNDVFVRAGLENENFNYYELGYIVTSEKHFRKGYAKAICENILNQFPTNNYFATTREDNHGMLKILNDLNFRMRGNSFKSTNGDYKLQLLTKMFENV